MKRAFTLVELMIVIVVIAILASITFRIAGIGQDSTARNRTIARMQRIENAISGYFAAYGSYPPVPLEGRSRNIYYKVNGYGIQQVESDPDTSELKWDRVEAACRAQPVAMCFPFASSRQEYVKTVSSALMELHNNSDSTSDYAKNEALAKPFDALDNPEMLSSKRGDTDWTRIQMFQFGLMSFLLPRYLVMMGHSNNAVYDNFSQWSSNNQLPCRFETGVPYESWSTLNHDLSDKSERWKIALLPSQSVCARWIANFENILACETDLEIYGVHVKGREHRDGGNVSTYNPWPVLYSAANSQGGEGTSGSQQYVLDCITCRDGWYHEFYYYSPPPYQTYRIWSAGPNGRTFPPWISPEEIEKLKEKNTVRNWMADDIVHMRN